MSDAFGQMVQQLAGDDKAKRRTRSRRRAHGDATGLRWQQHEMEFMRSHYAQLGAQACSEALGRTVKAVYTKAYELGLVHVVEGKQ